MEHKTNDWVWSKINYLVGPQEPLLATVKRRKLAWFGHITRHDSLFKTILQGTLEGGRRCSRQRKCWMDNNKELASLPMPELLTRDLCRKKKTGRGSLLNRPSCTPVDPICQGTELNNLCTRTIEGHSTSPSDLGVPYLETCGGEFNNNHLSYHCSFQGQYRCSCREFCFYKGGDGGGGGGGFSSLARIWGKMFDHSFPDSAFPVFFFF